MPVDHMQQQEKGHGPSLSPGRCPTHSGLTAVPGPACPRSTRKYYSWSRRGYGGSAVASQHPFPCPIFPDQRRVFFRGSTAAFFFKVPVFPTTMPKHTCSLSKVRSRASAAAAGRVCPVPSLAPERSVVLRPLLCITAELGPSPGQRRTDFWNRTGASAKLAGACCSPQVRDGAPPTREGCVGSAQCPPKVMNDTYQPAEALVEKRKNAGPRAFRAGVTPHRCCFTCTRPGAGRCEN